MTGHFNARDWSMVSTSTGRAAAEMIFGLNPRASNNVLNRVLEASAHRLCRFMLDAGTPHLTIQRCLDQMADAYESRLLELDLTSAKRVAKWETDQ